MINLNQKAIAQAKILNSVVQMLLSSVPGAYVLTVKYKDNDQTLTTTINCEVVSNTEANEAACAALATLGDTAEIINVQKVS